MNSPNNLEKKENEIGGVMLPDFKLYYKAIITKIVLYGHKMETQINETEQRVQKLIYDKGCKNVQEVMAVSSTSGVRKT